MSGCPGVHCPGCSEGQSLGIAAAAVVGLVLADQAVRWVAEYIWWIGGTLAVCFALSVAASMTLEAWADRRAARYAAAHGILSRADVILPEPLRVRAEVITDTAPASRPAIENHYHVHYHAADEAARAVIPGKAEPS